MDVDRLEMLPQQVGYSQRRRSDQRAPRAGSTSPSGSRTTTSATGVERGLLGVQDHEARAVPQRDLGQRRPRGRRRATCRSRGTRRRGPPRAATGWRSSGTRFSPKLIVADFRMPPHATHAGSSSPARTRSSVSSIGPRQSHAMHFASRTLPWISTTMLGRLPGRVVQPVDVLGDDAWQRSRAFERRRARRGRGSARRVHISLLTRFCPRPRRTSGSAM